MHNSFYYLKIIRMRWEDKYPDRFEYIAEYYSSGKTFSECTDEYIKEYKDYISVNAMRQALLRKEVDREYNQTKRVTNAKSNIVGLVAKGLNGHQIQKELNISRTKMFEILKEKGIKLKRGRKKKFRTEYPEDIVKASLDNQIRYKLFKELKEQYPDKKDLLLNVYLKGGDLQSVLD